MSALFALAVQLAARPAPPRHKVKQADLNAIADACDAPRTWLELRGREVIFRGPSDVDYAKVQCVVKGMSAIVPSKNIAIVGRARASEDK